jgi:hypothetical protein
MTAFPSVLSIPRRQLRIDRYQRFFGVRLRRPSIRRDPTARRATIRILVTPCLFLLCSSAAALSHSGHLPSGYWLHHKLKGSGLPSPHSCSLGRDLGDIPLRFSAVRLPVSDCPDIAIRGSGPAKPPLMQQQYIGPPILVQRHHTTTPNTAARGKTVPVSAMGGGGGW